MRRRYSGNSIADIFKVFQFGFEPFQQCCFSGPFDVLQVAAGKIFAPLGRTMYLLVLAYAIGCVLAIALGVLMGRFAGLVKVIANLELRAMPYPSLKVFGYRLRVGNTAFFDAGRVWADYGSSAADGHTLGLKIGVGGGFFFQWDESLVFRVEAAYSATNTSPFPVSFYLGTGLSF